MRPHDKLPVKVAQINAQRSRLVMHEIRRLQEEMHFDIICFQEPYTVQGRIPFQPATAQIIACGDIPMAAVIVYNRDIRATKVSQLCNPHAVCVEIGAPGGSWYISNQYFQYADPIQHHTEHLRRVANELGNRRVVYTLDANAKSHLWFSREMDDKGEHLEEIIGELQLHVANQPRNPYTYESRAGAKSNIDVTLLSPRMVPHLRGWKVGQGLTTSDHNVIYFEVTQGRIEGNRGSTRRKYNTKNADWERMRSELVIPDQTDKSVDVRASELTRNIKCAMSRAIPLHKKNNNTSDRPWSDKLLTMRRRVRKARRTYQHTVVAAEKELRLQEYRTLKNAYRQEIWKVKSESWRTFVEGSLVADPWGMPYRLATGKVHGPSVLSTLNRPDGGQTIGWQESAQLLMDTLLPDDRPDDDSADQVQLRVDMFGRSENGIAVCPFAVEEVEEAILRMKRGKAPGPDGISIEVLQAVCPQIAPTLCRLFNDCLIEGRIPNVWKNADVTILSKGDDKDPLQPKSYRPICLLNVMGKVQEKLICKRIKELRLLHGINDRQFGFTAKKSTEDAINFAVRGASELSDNYVIGIFVDISGAFDNLWWPALFARLRELNCPGALYNSLKDYCRGRNATIQSPGVRVTKTITKGCPQGSILGPEFWNIALEPILEKLQRLEDLAEVVAFADDILLIVGGGSRAVLERKATNIMSRLHTWCTEVKLSLAPHKTTYMLLRGQLQRDPVIRLDGRSIKRAKVTKYLGIHIDEKMWFHDHIRLTSTKAKMAMNRIIGISNRRFQLPMGCIYTYHEAILTAIAGYGASVWAHRLVLARPKRDIRSLQRGILLRLTGAFSTTSVEALTVVMGILPLDLKIRQRGAIHWVKRQNPAKTEEISGKRAISKGEARTAILDEWQREWEESEKGRRVFDFFPDIRARFRMKHLRPGKGLIHYLTGHGPYGTYLKKINRRANDGCPCGATGTPEHMMWECPLTADIEIEARQSLGGRSVVEILNDGDLWHLMDRLSNAVSEACRTIYDRRDTDNNTVTNPDGTRPEVRLDEDRGMDPQGARPYRWTEMGARRWRARRQLRRGRGGPRRARWTRPRKSRGGNRVRQSSTSTREVDEEEPSSESDTELEVFEQGVGE